MVMMRTLWLAALPMALLLAACGRNAAPAQGDNGAVKLDVVPGVLPVGWVEVVEPKLGFRVYVPQGWERLDATEASRQRVLAAFRQALPQASGEGFLAAEGKAADLELVDLDLNRLRSGNLQTLNVHIVPLDGDWNLSEVLRSNLAGGGANPVRAEDKFTSPIGPMAVVRAEDVVDNMAKGGQSRQILKTYLFGTGRVGWSIIFSYLADDEPRMKPIEEQIVRTIRVTMPEMEAIRADRQRVRNQENAVRDQMNAAAARDQQRQDPANQARLEQERQRQVEEEAVRQAEMFRQQQEREAAQAQAEAQGHTSPPVQTQTPPPATPPDGSPP